MSCEKRHVWLSSSRKAGTHNQTALNEIGQVTPVQIMLFDQTNLPVASPFLQLLLTCDRILRRCENFHVDEAMHTVFLHEFRAVTASMLLKPFPKVVGDPD